MILKRITVNSLPGILERFEIEAAGEGIQVIFGPNGIGKSSICRAVEALYWPERGSARQTSVSGEFMLHGETWRAEREGDNVRWSRGGDSSGPPGFPAPHNCNCFFLHLRDLVDSSQDSTQDVATEIRRQMSGGFDLEAIGSTLFAAASSPVPRNRRKKFNIADTHVNNAELAQVGLQRSVNQLEKRESELREAEAAEKRLSLVQRAIGLAERREALAAITQQLGALPGSLASMTGEELDEAREFANHLGELERRAQTLEADLSKAREAKKDSRLARPLDAADLAMWTDKADGLERIESQLSGAKDDLEATRNKLIAAGDAIGGDFVDNAAPTLPNHAELFEFLKSSEALANKISATRERLALLESIDTPEEGEHSLENLRSGCEALRAWLRAPQPEILALTSRNRRRLLLWAGGVLIAGCVAGYFLDPLLGYIAAVGAGLGLAAMLPANAGDAVHRAQAAQATYKELGIEEPERWDVSSVGALLRSLETRASELEASLKRSRDRRVEMKPLQHQLSELNEQRVGLNTRRDELKATLGLHNLSSNAELVDLARALDHLRLTSGNYQAISAKVRNLKSGYAHRLKELADILRKYGESRPEDAAAMEAVVKHHRGQRSVSVPDVVYADNAAEFVKSRVNRLKLRSGSLEQALAEEKNAKERLVENAADQESTRLAMARVYAKAEIRLGDEHGLASLLEKLPVFQELAGNITGLEGHNELDRTALADADETVLLEMDAQSLERLAAQLEQLASDAIRLRNEIADTGVRMDQARGAGTMQDLMAAREKERASLLELRDQALLNAAGTFLVREIEREYEQTRMPRVFEKARDHFSDFTFHHYELRLDASGGAPRLFALDLSCRQRRELQELSDGTRAQLLLAARIAFAEEVEQGRVLPLFLDEALDQSDPRRFAAIVGSLGRVARDQGRQIFYLTSDPLDVDRIRNALAEVDCKFAEPIDLGRERTGQASVSDAGSLALEPEAPVPAPGRLSAAEYGDALSVPPFRPGLGFASQHMLYVLWDDLELLHEFLTHGIERAGQWNTVAGAPLAQKLASGSIDPDQIGHRLDLLQVFCGLWKQGRGRPVDRDMLTDSGALSVRFLDDVVAIAGELHGDAERLLEVLAARADARLKGLRARGVARLRSYLVEHGCLDDRAVLTQSELRLNCLASPAANRLPEGIALACIDRWWAWSRYSSSAQS